MRNITANMALIVLILAGLSWVGIPAAASEREFWITPDPGFVLIDLEFPGAQTPTSSIYTLYADGRLVVKSQGVDGTIFRSMEHQVSAEAVTALLDDLVNSKIMEFDRAEVEERMGPKRRTFHISDDGGMRLFIGLQHYRAPGASAAKPAEVMIHMGRNPRFLAHHYPEIEEIQSLSRLVGWSYGHQSAKGVFG